MVSREILNSHPVAHLRKEISKTNIKGASKMKKAELVDVMMKHKERFSHITMRGKTERKAPPKKEAPKKEKNPFDNVVVPKTRVKKAPPKKEKSPEEKARLKKIWTDYKSNEMDPAELFSKLPKELHRDIGNTALAMKKKGGADLLKKRLTAFVKGHRFERLSGPRWGKWDQGKIRTTTDRSGVWTGTTTVNDKGITMKGMAPTPDIPEHFTFEEFFKRLPPETQKFLRDTPVKPPPRKRGDIGRSDYLDFLKAKKKK